MLPDFEMIEHRFYGGQDIKIIPIADLHLGSPECMEEEFLQFVDNVKNSENTFVTLGGDLLNNGIKSSVSSVYCEKYMPSQAKRMVAKMLEPIRDRILCAVCGNHEARSKRETDTDITLDIMSKLDLEHLYRENIAFVNVRLGLPRGTDSEISSSARPSYFLVVVHGNGGGMLTGGAVNRAERFGVVLDGADALILGHTHKPFITQPGKISIDRSNLCVSVKPFMVISATSWLRYGGYAAQKMLNPTTFAIQTLTLSGKGKKMSVSL